jgi:hypothetical protein
MAVTWTARTASAANTWWTSITYGNGLFVAVSSRDGTNRVMTSPDGSHLDGTYVHHAANTWLSVTYGNGLFVAVSVGGTNRVMTSLRWYYLDSADGSGIKSSGTPSPTATVSLWRSLVPAPTAS